MKVVREYVMALVSLIVTLVLTLIADVVLQLSPEGTYLTFVIGATVTLSATLLEKELQTTISEKIGKSLDLYRLVASIDDEDLKTEVFKLAYGLSLGEVPPHIAAIRSVELLENAQDCIYASDLSTTLDSIYRWNTSRLKTYYKGNLEAIKRGVPIERTFILSRNAVLTNDQWDPVVLEILKRQSKDGIQVRVLWQEDVTGSDMRPQRDILRDYVIYDKREVVEKSGIDARLYRSPSEKVQEFLQIYSEQKKFSRRLDEILEEEKYQ